MDDIDDLQIHSFKFDDYDATQNHDHKLFNPKSKPPNVVQ